MTFDGNGDLVAYGPANILDNRHPLLQLIVTQEVRPHADRGFLSEEDYLAARIGGPSQGPTETVKRPNLHRFHTLIQQIAGPPSRPRRIIRVLSVANASVVDGNSITIAATQQVVNRLAGMLPGEVPQSNVDGGDGAHLRARITKEIHQGEHVVPMVLDIERIAPDQQGCEDVVNHGADRAGGVIGFTQSC